MTVEAILSRAASLLDDRINEPNAEERHHRFIAALDSALGEIARVFPLQARCRITVEDGSAALPATVLTPRALIRAGRRVPLVVEEGRVLAEDGAYTLVYYRVPPRVETLEPGAALPYPEDVLRALPFYCAAIACMNEDRNLYNQLIEQYNTKISAALGYRPAASVEGGGSL